MKRILSITLSLILIIATLTGCGNANNSKENVLRVGMDLSFAPFSYLDDGGNVAGFEPQIAKAFGEYLGMEVEIVNTDFSMLIPALETGDVDILIADMSKTDERAEKVDFSDPYRYTYTLALVNKTYAEKNGITNDMKEEDFFNIEGIKFVGLTGTKGVFYPQKYGKTVTEVPEIGTGLMEVSNGISDVLVASNEVHGFHFADKNNTVVYSGIKSQDPSCFVVKKGNADLLEKSNAFIASMYEDGGLYDQIAPEWDGVISDFLKNDNLGLDYIVEPQK